MSKIYEKALFEGVIVDFKDANISIGSSAVLYGLSVYTVFMINKIGDKFFAFRLKDHFDRIENSCKIIGISFFDSGYTFENFRDDVSQLVSSNHIDNDAFIRVTIHVSELLPGTRSKKCKSVISVFAYESKQILPVSGAKIKISNFERVSNSAIPPRAKVNGAYVNSVLGKQEALDEGYDDCLFLDRDKKVCELSAANIFLVKNEKVFTPPISADILHGITRKTVIEICESKKIDIVEKEIYVDDVYNADEIFACGTSAFISSIISVDGKSINNLKDKSVTELIRNDYKMMLSSENDLNFLI